MTKHLFSKFLIVGIILLGFFGGAGVVRAELEPEQFQLLKNNLTPQQVNQVIGISEDQSPDRTRRVEALSINERNLLEEIKRGSISGAQLSSLRGATGPVADITKKLDEKTQNTRALEEKQRLGDTCPVEIGLYPPSWVNFIFTCGVIPVLGTLVWFASVLFDLSIKISVVDFAEYAKLPVFKEIWGLGRDFSNIFFIFILLYSAFDTLLGIGKVTFEKTITSIVLVAVLINFSFPIARIFIDVSNVFAYGMYKAINPEGNLDKVVVKSLKALGTTDLQNVANFSAFETGEGGNIAQTPKQSAKTIPFWTLLINMFGATIVLVTFSLTLLLASVFFIYRTVTLLILMTFSAIAFFTQLVPNPKASKYYGEWWGTLIDQTTFAPIYLLFLYFALKVITLSDGLQSAVKSSSVTENYIGLSSIGVAIYYVMVVLILNAALALAKDYGAVGTETITGWANKSREYILNSPKQLGRRVLGEGIVGGIARSATSKDGYIGRFTAEPLKDFAARNPRIGGSILRNTKTATEAFGRKEDTEERLKNASGLAKGFTSDLKRQATLLTSLQGSDSGVAQKVYEELSDRQKIAVENEADATQKIAISKLRDKYAGTVEQKEKLKEVEDKVNKEKEKSELKDKVNLLKSVNRPLTRDEIDNIQNIAKEDIHKFKEVIINKNVMTHLTNEQFKKFILSDKTDLKSVDITEINNILNSYGVPHAFNALVAGNQGLKDALNIP